MNSSPGVCLANKDFLYWEIELNHRSLQFVRLLRNPTIHLYLLVPLIWTFSCHYLPFTFPQFSRLFPGSSDTNKNTVILSLELNWMFLQRNWAKYRKEEIPWLNDWTDRMLYVIIYQQRVGQIKCAVSQVDKEIYSGFEKKEKKKLKQ